MGKISQPDSSYLLDPSSEYYRKCPYCKKEFMTSHLRRKFCEEKDCKSKFNNEKSRRKKMLALEAKKKEEAQFSILLKRNIEILDQLQLPRQGSIVKLADIVSQGFRWQIQSGWRLTNRERNERCLIFGPYELSLYDNGLVSINKI